MTDWKCYHQEEILCLTTNSAEILPEQKGEIFPSFMQKSPSEKDAKNVVAKEQTGWKIHFNTEVNSYLNLLI